MYPNFWSLIRKAWQISVPGPTKMVKPDPRSLKKYAALDPMARVPWFGGCDPRSHLYDPWCPDAVYLITTLILGTLLRRNVELDVTDATDTKADCFLFAFLARSDHCLKRTTLVSDGRWKLRSGQTQKPTSNPVANALKSCLSSKRLQSEVRQ